jgi:hypothetical protein
VRDFAKNFWTVVRSLARQPEMTVVVVLTLALGIGAATALFAYLASILWPTIDAPGAERMVWIYTGSADEKNASTSYPEYLDVQRQQKVIADLAAFWDFDFAGPSATVSDSGSPLTAMKPSAFARTGVRISGPRACAGCIARTSRLRAGRGRTGKST